MKAPYANAVRVLALAVRDAAIFTAGMIGLIAGLILFAACLGDIQ